MLFIITEALNDGWEPDFSNGNWDKYYPCFDFDNDLAIGDFSYYDDGSARSVSRVGSRLCYKSRNIAKYAVSSS
jgi:hypothetical protein